MVVPPECYDGSLRAMKSRSPLALAVLALSLTGVDAFQFRSSTELVSVYATVQDRTSRLVPDLKQEDFVITDNGQEQPIAFFSNDIAPFSVVVMLDRSGSMFQHQFVLRDAAAEFVRHMLPEDRARIGTFGDYFGNRVVISPSAFTSDKRELLDALRVPAALGAWSPVWIAIDQSITALSGREGRRIVLIFSDGYDEPVKTLVPVKLKDLAARVRQTNVMVYALGFVAVEPRPGKAPKITPPYEGLRTLADDSGGGYFEINDTADLANVFTRVAEELHRQYWLGFVPSAHDGKVHKIEVRVKSTDMTVRARQTYLAPAQGK